MSWNAKFKNSLPEIWIRNWPLSKYHPTFLALRFWRVNYNDQGKILNHLNIAVIYLRSSIFFCQLFNIVFKKFTLLS